jgi:hypothetical protein
MLRALILYLELEQIDLVGSASTTLQRVEPPCTKLY